MILRDPLLDKRKDAQTLKEQFEKDVRCKLSWCDEPLTKFKGPNDRHLCRGHQIKQREYGGLGRIDRPWTFSRKWVCDWCGYNPKEDLWFETQKWDDEDHKLRTMRNMLVGDHKIRKADGGADDDTNVQTLCQNCNSKKSGLNHDHRRSVDSNDD